MYGHDLIESLTGANNLSINATKNMDIFLLRQAQHFYFDDFIGIYEVTQNVFSGGAPLLSRDLSVRLPYKITALHFRINHHCPETNHGTKITKKIVLVAEDGDDLFVKEFNYVPLKGWVSTLFAVKAQFKGNEPYTFEYIFPEQLKHLEAEIGHEELYKESVLMIRTTNVALLLLNTKNIEHRQVDPPPKLNKKRAKTGKQPLFSYYTLAIRTNNITGNGQAVARAGEGENRIHLCRGHFKIYTDENPLMGKYTGRYWWQPHARGSAKAGVIMKDYSVKY